MRKGSDMNATRRKMLASLSKKVEELKSALESIMEEEEEYRDNMPENLQGSERYEKADEACYALEDAVSQLEDCVSSMYTAAWGD